MTKNVAFSQLSLISLTVVPTAEGGYVATVEYAISGNGEILKRTRPLSLAPGEEAALDNWLQNQAEKLRTSEGL